MNRENIKTSGDALVYITDCTLATVEHMNTLKRRSAHEFSRQVSIAQCGVNHCFVNGENIKGTRIEEVVSKHRGNVILWCKANNESKS